MIYCEVFVFWPTISSIPLPEIEDPGNLHRFGQNDLTTDLDGGALFVEKLLTR